MLNHTALSEDLDACDNNQLERVSCFRARQCLRTKLDGSLACEWRKCYELL